MAADSFRIELDRLRFEFRQLQREHRKGHPDSLSLQRHLDRLRRWIAHVEVFRRRFLIVKPEPDMSRAGGG
jgi:hypothetical protein